MKLRKLFCLSLIALIPLSGCGLISELIPSRTEEVIVDKMPDKNGEIHETVTLTTVLDLNDSFFLDKTRRYAGNAYKLKRPVWSGLVTENTDFVTVKVGLEGEKYTYVYKVDLSEIKMQITLDIDGPDVLKAKLGEIPNMEAFSKLVNKKYKIKRFDGVEVKDPIIAFENSNINFDMPGEYKITIRAITKNNLTTARTISFILI